jgi:predicted signal transduction protein with EAL and GGDEF domain
MPLDVLKLDADFFRGDSEGGRGEIVVSEAIKLAKALNMRTVAEGVEVRDQVDFLAKQGCDMIQGYYYAKPMAGADYELRMGMYSDDEPAESVLELTDSATDVVVEDADSDVSNDTVTDAVIDTEDVTDGMSVDTTENVIEEVDGEVTEQDSISEIVDDKTKE